MEDLILLGFTAVSGLSLVGLYSLVMNKSNAKTIGFITIISVITAYIGLFIFAPYYSNFAGCYMMSSLFAYAFSLTATNSN